MDESDLGEGVSLDDRLGPTEWLAAAIATAIVCALALGPGVVGLLLAAAAAAAGVVAAHWMDD